MNYSRLRITEDDLKPCRPELREAITAGSASISVSSNMGGITYNTLQYKHHIAVHLLYLGRLLSNDDQQAIALMIDSLNPGNKHLCWDRKPENRVVDPAVLQIVSAFQLEAQLVDTAVPRKEFSFFAIPTLGQQLNRGCVMHAVVNANLVTAVAAPLGDIVDSTLKKIPLCTAPYASSCVYRLSVNFCLSKQPLRRSELLGRCTLLAGLGSGGILSARDERQECSGCNKAKKGTGMLLAYIPI